MGSAGLMWPGAEKLFAAEAQRQRIPYVLATPGNASIEEIAAIAPDVFWFQLYRFPYDDHAITFDLVRRADEAGAHVLVPTVDSAGKSKRPRDIRNGVRVPFPINPWTTYQVLTSPAWTMAAPAQRHADHRQSRALCREGDAGRDRRDHAAALRRQPHLGRAQAPARPLEACRSWSRASCIRRTPSVRSRSAPTASACRTTAAGISTARRPSIDMLPAIVVGGRLARDR